MIPKFRRPFFIPPPHLPRNLRQNPFKIPKLSSNIFILPRIALLKIRRPRILKPSAIYRRFHANYISPFLLLPFHSSTRHRRPQNILTILLKIPKHPKISTKLYYFLLPNFLVWIRLSLLNTTTFFLSPFRNIRSQSRTKKKKQRTWEVLSILWRGFRLDVGAAARGGESGRGSRGGGNGRIQAAAVGSRAGTWFNGIPTSPSEVGRGRKLKML